MRLWRGCHPSFTLSSSAYQIFLVLLIYALVSLAYNRYTYGDTVVFTCGRDALEGLTAHYGHPYRSRVISDSIVGNGTHPNWCKVAGAEKLLNEGFRRVIYVDADNLWEVENMYGDRLCDRLTVQIHAAGNEMIKTNSFCASNNPSTRAALRKWWKEGTRRNAPSDGVHHDQPAIMRAVRKNLFKVEMINSVSYELVHCSRSLRSNREACRANIRRFALAFGWIHYVFRSQRDFWLILDTTIIVSSVLLGGMLPTLLVDGGLLASAGPIRVITLRFGAVLLSKTFTDANIFGTPAQRGVGRVLYNKTLYLWPYPHLNNGLVLIPRVGLCTFEGASSAVLRACAIIAFAVTIFKVEAWLERVLPFFVGGRDHAIALAQAGKAASRRFRAGHGWISLEPTKTLEGNSMHLSVTCTDTPVPAAARLFRVG